MSQDAPTPKIGLEPGEAPSPEAMVSLRAYIDAIDGFAGLLTLDGRVVECNAWTLTRGGLTRDQVVGMPFWWGPWWQHDKAVRQEIRQLIAQAATGRAHHRTLTGVNPQDGQPLVLRLAIRPMRDVEGEVRWLVPHTTNLTALHQKTQALQTAYQRLQQHMENTPLAVVEFDQTFRITRWSRQAVGLFGLPQNQATGLHLSALRVLHANSEAAFWRQARVLTEQACSSLTIRAQCTGADGETLYCRFHLSSIAREHATDPACIFALVEDITSETIGQDHLVRSHEDMARRVQERTQALAQSEARFQIAIQAMGEGIWEVEFTPQGQVNQFVSDRLVEMYGYTREAILSRNDFLKGLMHPEDVGLVDQIFARHLRHRTPAMAQYRLRTADGEWRWFRVRGQAVWDKETGRPTRLVGTVADIHDEMNRREALEATQQRLIQASRQAGKAEVASEVLHNVGNVLNSVNVAARLASETTRGLRLEGLTRAMSLLEDHRADLGHFLTEDARGQKLPGYLAQLTRRLTDDRARLQGELDTMTRDIEHLKQVIATQRGYARHGGLTQEVNPVHLLEDALRMNQTLIHQHNIEVERAIESAPQCLLDRDRVLQILVNLIRNAAQAIRDRAHAEHGQHQGRLTLHLTDGTLRGCLVFAVQDNGVGIDPEAQTRIFGFGYTTKADGSGFGLHASALDAQAMGGQLTVESAGPGHGALFALTLPLKRPDDQPTTPS